MTKVWKKVRTELSYEIEELELTVIEKFSKSKNKYISNDRNKRRRQAEERFERDQKNKYKKPNSLVKNKTPKKMGGPEEGGYTAPEIHSDSDNKITKRKVYRAVMVYRLPDV